MADESLRVVELDIDEETELPAGGEGGRDGDPPLQAVAGTLLHRGVDADPVNRGFEGLEGFSVRAVRKNIGNGWMLVEFDAPPGLSAADALHGVLELNRTSGRRADDPIVRVNRVVGCPRLSTGGRPVPPDPANPPADLSQLGHGLGAGVTVAVLDTTPINHAQLERYVEGMPAPASDDSYGIDEMAAGHCLLVAGVILRFAPAAKIRLIGVLGNDGYGSDAALAEALVKLEGSDVQLINLSLGTAGELLPAASTALAALHGSGVGIIAAAGNQIKGIQLTHRYQPAADPNVVGVASVVGSGDELRLTSWTQRGSWVRVVSRGSHRYGPFVTGRSSYGTPGETPDRRRYQGWCYWDGTSFATPVVTGAAAAFLSANPGMTGAQALEAMIAASLESDFADETKARLVDPVPSWPTSDPGVLVS